MKANSILAAVLMAVAGSAYAADVSDLQTFKVRDVKAVEVVAPLTAPENVSKGAAAIEALSEKAVVQSPIKLNIKAKDGIRLSAKGVYVASSGSFSCTHTSFSDGSVEHLPDVVEKAIAVAVSGEDNRINADRVLNDSCRSELRGLIVRADHAKIVPEYNRIEIVGSAANQDTFVQIVAFMKIESPYVGLVYVSGDAKILVGPNGTANAEVSLQK